LFRPKQWEYWRQRGTLTEMDNLISTEFTEGRFGDILHIVAKITEFMNRVGSALATEENIKLMIKHNKFEILYKELANRYGDEAKAYADEIADITQFRWGIEEKPVIFDNPIMNLYYQYNTFALKQLEFTEEIIRNTKVLTIWDDFKKANEQGKDKEFWIRLTQGERAELFYFILNAALLSFLLSWSYVWEAIFKGIVPNQVEGVIKFFKGLWQGDDFMRKEGLKQVMIPPAIDLITKLADYGVKGTIKNMKAVKQIDLIEGIIEGEVELRDLRGRHKEDLTREVAWRRLFMASREKTALINHKGWDKYKNLEGNYFDTREKAVKLIKQGKKEEAKQLARQYNQKAKPKIKELKELEITDLRLEKRMKGINKRFIVSKKDFVRWIKTAKEY